MCENKFISSLIVSSFYAGMLSVLWWVPVLSDRHGRKNLVQSGSVINSILYTVLLLTSNKFMLMAVIFLTGASMSLTFTVGFIYLIELMPKNRQAVVSTV